jgi:ACT domain-containing protein
MTETGGLYEQIERTDRARLIIAAFGKDRPGVVAAISKVLGDASCTIEDISQTLMQEFFSMIMIANMKDATTDFATLRDQLKECEQRLGMKVYVMHEDIFRYMHRI